MKALIFVLALVAFATPARAAAMLRIEKQVAEIAASPAITVVHFWAPWCPNCKAELASNGWSEFVRRNPKVNVVFMSTWSDGQGDGRALLARYGVGGQENFRLFLHPNTSRKPEDRMTQFLGLPVTWLPATWIFREGKLRYALNYGEVRFPILQQLVDDSLEAWER